MEATPENDLHKQLSICLFVYEGNENSQRLVQKVS